MSTEKFKISTTDELSEHESYVIEEVKGREIAVFNVDGEYHAILNYCVHQGGPVCEGGLTGKITVGDDGWEWHYDESEKLVRCPWHNWGFDIETGVNANDDQYRIPTYDVEVEDGDIYVCIS